MTRLLLLLLALPAGAQIVDQVFPLPLFKDGLYTRYSANAIPDGGLAEALNVLLDQDVDGVVVARNGYSKYNTTAITDTKTVRGLWAFDASDGTKYMVAHSSQNFYKTTGDGIWTAITGANNFSVAKDFDCVQTLGKLYCGNTDTVFSWDGTSTATVSAAPLGNLLGRFRNRLLIAGVSGAKSRLRGSGELDTSDWTLQIPGVSTTPFSIALGGSDDGEDITCLMGAFQDVFVIGKRSSLWGLYGFGRTDFQVRELSREVGCLEQRSVREKNNCLYWLSQRGVEKFCGASIDRVGDPIRNNIDTIVAAAGNTRSLTDTTQSDFEQGNLTASGPGAPMNTTIAPNSLVSSRTSFTDGSAAEFAQGTLTNTVTRGASIGLVISTNSTKGGSFTDASKWTENDAGTSVPDAGVATNGGAFSSGCGTITAACPSGSSACGIVPSGVSVPSGCGGCATGVHPSLSVKDGKTGAILATYIPTPGTNGVTYTATHTFQTVATSSSVYFCFGSRGSGYGVSFSCGGGFSTLQSAGGVTDAIGWNVVYDWVGQCQSSVVSYVAVSNIRISSYSPVGTYTSRTFDTSFSTPTMGSAFVNVSSNSVGTLTVQEQNSSDGSSWSTASTLAYGAKVLSGKRYWRYIENYATSNGTTTASSTGLESALTANTTGHFISQCRNTTGVTSWGLLSCNLSQTGGGSITLAVATGTSCNMATRSTATFTTTTNNTTISVATAAFVSYRAFFNFDISSQAASSNLAVLDCAINFTEGGARPPVATQVYRDRYYLSYTSSTASGAINDHMLVLDKNDKWTIFDNHSCYSMSFYNRKLYCGSSTSVGRVWLLDSGTDDDGTAITARIRTKAFNVGMPERRKEFHRLYLDLEPSPDPSQSITLTARYTLERSTPTYPLGTVDLNEDPGSLLTPRIPFPIGNPVSGRNIQLELESTGLNSPWRLFGGRLYYSPLEPE